MSRTPLLFLSRSTRLPTGLTVGEAAARLQSLGYRASTSLIRKLERERLIEVPTRTEGNYRVIDEETFGRLRAVLGLRALGLSVETIRKVLPVLETRRGSSTGQKELLDHLDALISKRVRQLNDLKAVLRRLRH
jgi:DNA-binding transcriptional MerR regulator